MNIKEIPIKEIKILENIRQTLKEEAMPYLMQSIKENGLLQPIGVKEENNGYTLIWGFRRLLAFKKLGYKMIPAVIFIKKDEELSEEEFFVLNATENMQRKPNTLLEFGRVCTILKRTMSNGEIASRLGVPRQRVESALVEINRIPKKWHKKIKMLGNGEERKGDIPLSLASKIGSLRNITTHQKEQLLNWVAKDEIEVIKMQNVASLMKKGLSFSESKNSINKYKTIHFKVMVNIEKFDKLRENYNSEFDLIIDAINKLAKDDIALRINDRQESVRIKE
jgi:ParB/RepB/Spo0J family partition protein